MATNEPPKTGAAWDEAQCTTALAHLERVQEQISTLRLAIPQVVAPFNSHSSDSATIYKSFQKAIVETQNDMKTMRSMWEDQETKRVFAHTKESFSKDKDLSPMAKLPRYGWVKKEEAMKKKKDRRRSGGELLESHDVILSQTEIVQLLEEWRKTNPTIKVETKDNPKAILIQLLSRSALLKFRVFIETDANGRQQLIAECFGTPKICQAVTRCLLSRPRANDFKHLLDMIAAYKTVKGNCQKCGLLLDGKSAMPAARRSRTIDKGEGVQDVIWEAFHEVCLD